MNLDLLLTKHERVLATHLTSKDLCTAIEKKHLLLVNLNKRERERGGGGGTEKIFTFVRPKILLSRAKFYNKKKKINKNTLLNSHTDNEHLAS